MTPDEHIDKAEELMEQSEANLAYSMSEIRVEKGHAQAVLAQAHIDMARLKANG
jgi:hypothetical protein